MINSRNQQLKLLKHRPRKVCWLFFHQLIVQLLFFPHSYSLLYLLFSLFLFPLYISAGYIFNLFITFWLLLFYYFHFLLCPLLLCTHLAKLNDQIKKQIEYYFSKENLSRDSYLVSLMNSHLFVPISELVKFQQLSLLTTDVETIAKSVEGSELVVLSKDRTMIKPNMQPPQRTTVLWRKLPATVPEDVCS